MRIAPCILLLCILWSCGQKPSENHSASVSNTPTYSCCSPEILDTSWFSSGKKAPLFSGLAGMHYAVSTSVAEAQQYFDQGLMLSFGFNHAEAARSFFEATRQDSSCAMCWWGYAYVLGPNYNAGMDPGNFQRANDAILHAQRLTARASAKEKELCNALAQRYSADTSIARPILDSTYCDAMRSVYRRYPDDVTIATLFAESMMDLHPWNLWQKDGTIQPWTPEIIEVLKKCLASEPRHAGANHFYIHATEMSQHAEVAMASADLLRDLVPGSGHLCHMPSHTYIRTGRYHDGVLANQQAVLVDSLYMEACHAQGVYPLAYYPHNFHFMSACATLCGESKLAIEGAEATANHAHQKLMRDPMWATLQHYYTIPWFVEVKLAKWDVIRKSVEPDSVLFYPRVIWHYAQGMAALSSNKITDAQAQLAEIHELLKEPSLREMTIWGINSVGDICTIASEILEGEIHAREGHADEAIRSLTQAVAHEDALNYDEPPDWFFSVRHHLGAVLVESGKYREAIAVYETDLRNFPENGWALRGLMNAYEKLGDRKKYEATRTRFEAAWKYADTTINGSRIF